MSRLVVIGDALLDRDLDGRATRLAPDAPVPVADDPRAILRELRPHVWATGGDHAAAELPEAATPAEWGGRAVVVPYAAGRSTTELIEVARAG